MLEDELADPLSSLFNGLQFGGTKIVHGKSRGKRIITKRRRSKKLCWRSDVCGLLGQGLSHRCSSIDSSVRFASGNFSFLSSSRSTHRNGARGPGESSANW